MRCPVHEATLRSSPRCWWPPPPPRQPSPSKPLPAKPAAPARPFDVFEASIPEMQAAMKSGRTTSHAIVQQYLTRIANYEDLLHAAITVNPKALEEADARDRERAQGRLRGPLHGIPIALKDNIHTTDMRTTGGALAFEWLVPPYEATLDEEPEGRRRDHHRQDRDDRARQLRRAPRMPTNYNAVHGYGMNPYDPRRDPRSDGRPILQTGGSSSGIGTAANFWAGNVGTETSGSILSPSNQNMLAAIKPTVGPHQPLRRDPDHRGSGHAGADGEVRERHRDHVRRARGRVGRSERRRDEDVHAAARPRLHEVPEGRRSRRGRASAFRARTTTSRSIRPSSGRAAPGAPATARRRRARRRTWRTESRADEGDGRGDRRAESARARS